MKRRSLAVGLSLLAVLALSDCGSSSAPSSPTPTPTPVATKVIVLPGAINFGTVQIGQTADQSFTIQNTGNSTMTVTSISIPAGSAGNYSATFTSGPIAAGASQPITIRFSPTAPVSYGGVIKVNSDATSGNNGINVTAIGDAPVFAFAGSGNTVFNGPTYLTKLHIVADYTGNSSNFIMYNGPNGSACGNGGAGCHLIVNELIGRAWTSTHYDAIVLVTGGLPQFNTQDSSGVTWSVTEVR
jgi:hypothetical protein